MLAKSRWYSRQLTRWVAFVSVLLAISPAAHALLEESEKTALSETLQVYKQSQSLSDFIERNSNNLSFEAYSFLSRQAKAFNGQRLPKMTVHNDTRISFKVDGSVYKIDFVSVRTQLMAINGHEVEFLPSDSPEARLEKVLTALAPKHASASPLMQILENDALAAAKPAAGGKDIPDDHMRLVSANLNSLALIAQSVLEAANNKDLSCDKLTTIQNQINKYLPNATDTEVNDSLRQEMLKQLKADHPGQLADPDSKTDAKDYSKEKYNCKPDDNVDIKPDRLDAVKKAGPGANIDPNFYDEKTTQMPKSLNKDQINALSRANVLNDTFKWKLQQIRDALIALKAADNKCYTATVEKLDKFFAQLKTQVKTGRLRCYIDQVNKDIKNGAPSAGTQGQQPPPKTNR